MKRLYGLDMVRGLCAISVMIYHVLAWTKAATIEAAGTYGVYVFFILSGCSLAYVYGRMPMTEKTLREFFVARAFRIIPLYAGVVIFTYFQRGSDLSLVLLNVTLLFGFTNPGATSLVTGGWSIGVEAVFYLLFPLLLLFRNIYALGAIFLLSLLMNLIYVPTTLTKPWIDDHWNYYTQPVTFLCYFVGGMLIARLGLAVKYGWGAVALSLAVMFGIFAMPEVLDLTRNQILTGWTSLALIAASLVTVAVASTIAMPRLLVGVSQLLGDVSYSVYLLHPFIFGYLNRLMAGQSPYLVALATVVVTVAFAKIVYMVYEKPTRDLRYRFSRSERRPDPVPDTQTARADA